MDVTVSKKIESIYKKCLKIHYDKDLVHSFIANILYTKNPTKKINKKITLLANNKTYLFKAFTLFRKKHQRKVVFQKLNEENFYDYYQFILSDRRNDIDCCLNKRNFESELFSKEVLLKSKKYRARLAIEIIKSKVVPCSMSDLCYLLDLNKTYLSTFVRRNCEGVLPSG